METSQTTPDNQEAVKTQSINEDPKTIDLATLKRAFRAFKLSRKQGPALIVTRYTRHGRKVY